MATHVRSTDAPRKSVDWTDQRSSKECYISEDTTHKYELGIPIWKRDPTERSSESSDGSTRNLP